MSVQPSDPEFEALLEHLKRSRGYDFPVERLKASVRACIDGSSDAEEVEAVNRLGKSMLCRASVAPFRGNGSEVNGAVLVMEEHRPPTSAAGDGRPNRGK